jgi:protein kinase-like protein
VQALDLVRVGKPVAASGVDDHAVEHIGVAIRKDVLDGADRVTVRGHDIGAFGEDEVRNRVTEIHGDHLPLAGGRVTISCVTELEPGDEFAGCRIEAVAGRGGMGVVYRATELSLGRPVALKLLTPDRARDSDFRERFQRESRMAAAIDHPNVIPVYAAGEQDGSLYLVMRYVGGTDLHALLRDEGALGPDLAAHIVAQVASALDAAHRAGLVHRDVKPANVLLAGEHAYLSDFGLTRLAGSDTSLTQSGQWIGTVEYCSPEQLRGGRTDARADVYALGCVLFAALSGRPPFAHGTVPATMLAHLNDPPPMPSERGAPREFDRVLTRALAKAPGGRYPSAGDLGRAALAAARGEPVTESERSVAVGPAAPTSAVNGGAKAARSDGAHDTDLTRWDPAAHEPTEATRWDPAAHEPTEATRWDPAAHEPTEATRWDPAAHEPADATHGDDSGAAEDAATWDRAAREDLAAHAAATGHDEPPQDRHVVRARRWPYRFAAGTMIFAALVAVGLALGQIFDAPVGSAARSGPLTEDEVRTAAEQFADAYAHEDAPALRQTLARNVTRVLPGGRSQGRDQVVDQYQRQFDGKVGGYDLNDLTVTGGRVGRASGTYHVDRKQGDAYDGTIVFGVIRERGAPRISLIAAQPAS